MARKKTASKNPTSGKGARAAKAASSTKTASAKKAATKKAANKQAAAKKTASNSQFAPKTKKSTKSASTSPKNSRSATSSKKADKNMSDTTLPKPRFNKDGLGYTKDFPLSFIKEQYEALQQERIRLTGQANRLEEEAHALVENGEMGDVQFDDEGGEGDTIAVERERDIILSAQARETVREIDDALKRIAAGTYGYSVVSGQPIPQERLEALPWSTVLVEEKVGGIGRR